MPIAGAVYWNAYYPGHLHVPENTAYMCSIEGISCIVVVVRHLDAIVVTDFSNDFLVKKKGDRTHVFLKKPIPYKPEDTIAVDFKARGNLEEQRAVWTKDKLYQVYRKQSFTEISVAVECESESSSRSQDVSFFTKALDEFLNVYRVVAVDPKAQKYLDLQINSPTIRRCYRAYQSADLTTGTVERVLKSLPTKYPDFVQFCLLEFAQDATRLESDPQEVATRVGHHLAVGTKISENQSALLECFAQLTKTKNFRYAVIDAFSVAEVAAFDLVEVTSKGDTSVQERHRELMKRNGRITVKDVIHSFLPHILSDHLAVRPTLIGDLDKCRKRRHEVAHERSTASVHDAEFALNVAQQLIFAIEEYRGERPAT